MLRLIILSLAFGSLTTPASTISSTSIVTVNGEPIYESDLDSNPKPETRDDKIRRAIQYRLMVQEAKRRGLERAPEIQTELNKLLYKKLLNDERKSRKKQLSATDTELHNYYSKFPLLRVRHLVLNQRNETERQLAALALEQIRKSVDKGIPFEQICTKFSQESTGLFGGDSDFRGPHNFPKDLYIKIRALPKNAVSDPIEVGHSLHLFQWFDKQPFTTAPASYLQFLQAQLEEDKEALLLSELVRELELKASIEPRISSVITK